MLATVGIRDAQSCCQRGSVSVKGRADEIASRADCRGEDHQNNNATWKAGTTGGKRYCRRYCTSEPVSLSFAESVCLRLPDYMYEKQSLATYVDLLEVPLGGNAWNCLSPSRLPASPSYIHPGTRHDCRRGSSGSGSGLHLCQGEPSSRPCTREITTSCSSLQLHFFTQRTQHSSPSPSRPQRATR